jgi:hypothetical protein
MWGLVVVKAGAFEFEFRRSEAAMSGVFEVVGARDTFLQIHKLNPIRCFWSKLQQFLSIMLDNRSGSSYISSRIFST